ncbi:uncharacterized protein KGF55_005685 [Candida pseudojiufengensis]|uniref:uncharacterized protein n=1 Tax=Candida pseudojiufengensis TaxID=497109 RepID=UPI0022245830|nr:uncharacterized protein KGF55_005685 [Candida pseudojiufengensis]KAI5958687.1 hypothetical protein KGF55_005685 [Candida pseudojiufengensis]
MEEEPPAKVQVYVYDLSKGLAKLYSPMLLGFEIEAIYHTSVVVRGEEYYLDQGIKKLPVKQFHEKYGSPIEIIDIGETYIDDSIILEFINDLNNHEEMKYHAQNYDLFKNNCNHFTNTMLEFLCDKKLNDKILNLPEIVLKSPAGQMLQNMIQNNA